MDVSAILWAGLMGAVGAGIGSIIGLGIKSLIKKDWAIHAVTVFTVLGLSLAKFVPNPFPSTSHEERVREEMLVAIPAMGLIEQEYPEEFNAFVARVATSRNSATTQQMSAEFFTSFKTEHLANLRAADDAALRTLIEDEVRLHRLILDGPGEEACYTVAMGGEMPAGFFEANPAHFQDMVNHLIEALIDGGHNLESARAVPSDDDFVALNDYVSSTLENTNNLALFANGTNAPGYCQGLIDYFSAMATFEGDSAGRIHAEIITQFHAQ